MLKRPLLLSILALVGLLLTCTIWLVLQTGPLGALSLPPPLSLGVHTEASPCILALTADNKSADRAAIARALNSYAASNRFNTDADSIDKTPGSYASATYTGPGTLTLLFSSDTRHVTLQLFKDGKDDALYAQQIKQAVTTFTILDMKQTACQ